MIYGGTAPGSFISGGTGADTIVGGANYETIYGNGGPDVLIAGGTHDLVYADNPSGDTSAVVSYLYGTYAGEPGAGTDNLIGGPGNDYLFGYGDTITPGGAGSIVDNSLTSNPAPSAPPPVPTGNLPQLPAPVARLRYRRGLLTRGSGPSFPALPRVEE